jgi:hypothetical protein
MKITNADVIKNGEKDLIDSITADLDWGAIEEIFLTEHNLGIDEDIEYKSGDIVAHDSQVAYKLEFTVKVNLSVLISRDGEYLSVNISGKKAKEDHEKPDGDSDSLPETANNGMESDISAQDIDKKEDKYIEAFGELNSDHVN